MTAKSVLVRPQRLRPRARAPTCPPSPYYATGQPLGPWKQQDHAIYVKTVLI